MHGSYDDMMDWKHREENGGQEREIAYIPNYTNPEAPDYVSPEDFDPELDEMVHGIYAHDNAGRRERNHRAEVAGLRGLLEEHGIEIPDHI